MLARLWSGGYPLPVAFWVFYIGGLTLLYLVSLLTVSIVALTKGGLWLLLILYAVIWAYRIFISVAVWRSATPYVATGSNKKIWAYLARIVVMIGLAEAAWTLLTGNTARVLTLLMR